MKQTISWKNAVLSLGIAAALLAGLVALQLSLGGSVSIYLKTFLIGGALSLVVSGLLLHFKKPGLLALAALAALAVWFLVGPTSLLDSALLAAGAVGLLCSAPFWRLPQR